MRAIIVRELGGPEVLAIGERDDPQPKPGEIVVKVAAAGVNYMDIYQRSGIGAYKAQTPYTPGAEGAGTVLAVGEGVTDFAVGDPVAWASGPGSYAEQVALPAASAVPVPHGFDLKIAAAVMLQGMTAHYLCNSTFPIQEGNITVVHAAAGGVGLLLTQMIKTARRHRGRHDLHHREGRARAADGRRPRDQLRRVRRGGQRGSPASAAPPSSSTAWARPPSRPAWPRCGRAA